MQYQRVIIRIAAGEMMIISMLLAKICFIACNGASADHFAVFAESLPESTVVDVLASEEALKKLQEHGLEVKNSFALNNL